MHTTQPCLKGYRHRKCKYCNLCHWKFVLALNLCCSISFCSYFELNVVGKIEINRGIAKNNIFSKFLKKILETLECRKWFCINVVDTCASNSYSWSFIRRRLLFVFLLFSIFSIGRWCRYISFSCQQALGILVLFLFYFFN